MTGCSRLTRSSNNLDSKRLKPKVVVSNDPARRYSHSIPAAPPPCMFGVAPKFGEDECTQSMTRSPTKYEVPGQFDLKHIPRDDTVPIEDSMQSG